LSDILGSLREQLSELLKEVGPSLPGAHRLTVNPAVMCSKMNQQAEPRLLPKVNVLLELSFLQRVTKNVVKDREERKMA
jgi:hypothetical protein